LRYLVRAFPLRREIVHPFSVLYLAQDKISRLNLLGPDPLTVIAVESLLITGGSHRYPGTDFLEEVDVINPWRALSVFIIRMDLW
jgi:hypothetical protein